MFADDIPIGLKLCDNHSERISSLNADMNKMTTKLGENEIS